MTKEEDTQHGLGYASGREDASGVKTLAPGPEKIGWLEFGYAYGAAWDAYNRGELSYMTSLRAAYEMWQDTRGATIFYKCNECGHYPQAMEIARRVPVCLNHLALPVAA